MTTQITLVWARGVFSLAGFLCRLSLAIDNLADYVAGLSLIDPDLDI